MQDLTIQKALLLAPRLPRLDREVLLSHALGQDRVFLMAHGETRMTPGQTKRYRSFLARAKEHEPIAYIIGTREFYGRDFFVGPGVLIPRPETELLVEQALGRITKYELRSTKKKKVAIVDIGTGSGNIIISIASSLETPYSLLRTPYFKLFAVDTSTRALRIARKNARRHAVTDRITFIQSDLLQKLTGKLKAFDEILILANLPYLSSALYRRVAPNVKRYEPKNALLSGKDGLDHYRRLMSELLTINRAGVKITFFLEISPEQTKKLPALFADITALSSLEIIPDLAGKSRLVIGVIEKSQNKNPA